MGSRRAFICRLRVGANYDQQQQQQYNSYNQQQQNFNYLNRTNIHQNALGEQNTNIDGGNYAVVHITGYTKTWPPTVQQQQMVDIHDTNNNNNGDNQFCLIAIARIQVTNMPNDTINGSSNLEFVTRLDQNGVITFVDQK
jgi:aryl hydrocarbon receptor nuclear translocator